jgi:hypothetical protein
MNQFLKKMIVGPPLRRSTTIIFQVVRSMCDLGVLKALNKKASFTLPPKRLLFTK